MNPNLAAKQAGRPPARKGTKFRQGLYTPKNPAKYMGDATKIRYMSSWELETHKFFDNNPRVLKWASEEIAIPYLKPTDGKMHKYYPDYFIIYINNSGEECKEIIEVKPLAQTKMPRAGSKPNLYESLTLSVNIAKWQAAQAFCKARNMTFRIITEKSIFK